MGSGQIHARELAALVLVDQHLVRWLPAPCSHQQRLQNYLSRLAAL